MGRTGRRAGGVRSSLCRRHRCPGDTYIFGFILLVVLWSDALKKETRTAWVLLLFAATVGIGTGISPGFLYWRVDHLMAFQFAPAIAGVVVGGSAGVAHRTRQRDAGPRAGI